ncbi:MAG: hypothetical protein PUC88_06295 [Clostridia bacterium]|nr:hypothetical protein [Clostridia bacterium]
MNIFNPAFKKLSLKGKVRVLIGTHRSIFFILFKVLAPFVMTMIQLDYVCVMVSWYFVARHGANINNAYMTLIAYAAFLVILIAIPEFASFLEFIIHPLYFILAIKLISMGRELLSLYIILGMLLSIVLLASKIIFFFTFILEDELKKDKEDSSYDKPYYY